MNKLKKPYINRELSWLSFNERVLQEAADVNVPLIERLKFLGIFSSNLDEFFRVRVASNLRLLKVKKTSATGYTKQEISHLLEEIQHIVLVQQDNFKKTYEEILSELKKNNIHIVNEKQLNKTQQKDVIDYFHNEVAAKMFPLILVESRPMPELRDGSIYLAVKMKNSISGSIAYALLSVPSQGVSRFYILQDKSKGTFIMLLDDIIRLSLPEVFSNLDYNIFEAYTIKITRDAELDFDSDFSADIAEKIKKSLELRKKGDPVRLVFDESIPKDLLRFLVSKLKIKKDGQIPGGRYHNFRDFIKFPSIGNPEFRYSSFEPLHIKKLDDAKSMFTEIAEKDFLISHPYHSFDYVARFLKEAAIDPAVFSIKITLYRVAEYSNVATALINAVKNGKKVTAVMELFARFDEEHNLYWANKLKEAGVEVLFGPHGIKVHSKLCIISRRENFKTVHYAHIGTGNYNGDTSKLYADHAIFTSNQPLLKEAHGVFDIIKKPNLPKKFNLILAAPVNLRAEIIKKIEREIKLAKKGKTARIIFKMNSLVDEGIIYKIYEAAEAGVKISIISRSICCLIPYHENIEAFGIVDRFLEHSRLYYFYNEGKSELYLGSADLMPRNLDSRVELLIPVLDETIKNTLLRLLNLQLSDNTKSRVIDALQSNTYRFDGKTPVRSQFDFYEILKQFNQ